MRAVIFDLDGVLVRTDQAHDKAWRALAGRLGIPFDGRAAARLRGVSRMEALDIVLEGCGRSFTPAEKEALAAEKNERYRALIAEMTPADVAPDTTVTLKALRERGLLLAVASSSKNARFILERTGLTPYFHAVVDGTQIARSKPDPEVFLKAAQALGVSPAEALVVEDAAAGVRAAHCGGFSSAALGPAAGGPCGPRNPVPAGDFGAGLTAQSNPKGGRAMGRRCLILALTALLLTGCAGSPGQSAATLAPAESDRVVIYTSHKEEVYGPIVKEFEARTGIWAEVVTGGTNELLARIAGEADAPVCDVIFGGGVESLTAYERYFQPYACAEADLIRPGLRPADDLWTPFSSLPVVLIYNTKLVSPGELTGWESLLSGRWSGSIALADPAVSGSSYTAAATMLCALPGDDWDQLDRLAVQLEGRVLPDSGDVVAAVAGGSCRVGVTLEETALKRQAQGADIAIVYPEEGTSAVPDGSALIAGAPHPDNARAFLDFAQSRDVQELVVSQFSRRSVRTDVSDGDALPPADELALIDYPVRWAAELKDAFSARWPELLREEALS